MSSAFTGPLPVATVISRSSATSTVMVASDSVTSSLRAFQRRSSMTRKRGELEELGHLAQRAPRQELEARLGAVIGIAVVFARLHRLDQSGDLGIVGLHRQADVAEAGEDIGPARLVGDHDMSPVAHQPRLDVLVGARILLHRGDMQAPLMGEGGFADIGGAAQRARG